MSIAVPRDTALPSVPLFASNMPPSLSKEDASFANPGCGQQPVSVFVFDLVSHSTRPREEADKIQEILREVFAQAHSLFNESTIRFRHTGDGYFCVFLGSSVGSVVDFLHETIPELTERFESFEQRFRGGIDFGLVVWHEDILTRGPEFFESAGINAARLESAALPNEILCTSGFRDLFVGRNSSVFGDKPRSVTAKDRTLSAFPIYPIDFHKIQRSLFERLVLGKKPNETSRPRVAVVDDEYGPRESIAFTLGQDFEVEAIDRASEALRRHHPDRWDVVVSDIRMPEMDGIRFIGILHQREPSLPIIMLTGYGTLLTAQQAMVSGATQYLRKPPDIGEFIEAVRRCAELGRLRRTEAHSQMVADSYHWILPACLEIGAVYRAYLAEEYTANSTVVRMIAHKCKQIGTDFLSHVGPRRPLARASAVALAQCACLRRMLQALTQTPGASEGVTS